MALPLPLVFVTRIASPFPAFKTSKANPLPLPCEIIMVSELPEVVKVFCAVIVWVVSRVTKLPASCLELKVTQSAADKSPRLVALAVGRLIVIFPLDVIGEPLTLTSVPLLPKVIPTEVTPTSKLPCMKV